MTKARNVRTLELRWISTDTHDSLLQYFAYQVCGGLKNILHQTGFQRDLSGTTIDLEETLCWVQSHQFKDNLTLQTHFVLNLHYEETKLYGMTPGQE